MAWRFLSRDEWTGAIEHYSYDPDSDRCIIRRTADVAAVIESNKRSELDEDGWTKGKTMRLAARIPPDVQYEWLRRYGIRAWDKNHAAGVRRLLNDSEWRYLRYGKRHFII